MLRQAGNDTDPDPDTVTDELSTPSSTGSSLKIHLPPAPDLSTAMRAWSGSSREATAKGGGACSVLGSKRSATELPSAKSCSNHVRRSTGWSMGDRGPL